MFCDGGVLVLASLQTAPGQAVSAKQHIRRVDGLPARRTVAQAQDDSIFDGMPEDIQALAREARRCKRREARAKWWKVHKDNE